jgi:hypothetical protein
VRRDDRRRAHRGAVERLPRGAVGDVARAVDIELDARLADGAARRARVVAGSNTRPFAASLPVPSQRIPVRLSLTVPDAVPLYAGSSDDAAIAFAPIVAVIVFERVA